jgi:bifunctional polynucleotide phosphatase/kinase
MIFKGFQKAFEEPKVEEGFTELVAVNWLFVGTDVEREHWNKWMPNLS